MKKILYSFILLATVIVCSCKKESKNVTLGIDVQAAFNNDSVKVFLDGEEVISKRLITNNALGVCLDGIFSTTKTTGEHEIKVVVNNTATKIGNFSASGNLYMGIRYEPVAGDISIIYSDIMFVYD